MSFVRLSSCHLYKTWSCLLRSRCGRVWRWDVVVTFHGGLSKRLDTCYSAAYMCNDSSTLFTFSLVQANDSSTCSHCCSRKSAPRRPTLKCSNRNVVVDLCNGSTSCWTSPKWTPTESLDIEMFSRGRGRDRDKERFNVMDDMSWC